MNLEPLRELIKECRARARVSSAAVAEDFNDVAEKLSRALAQLDDGWHAIKWPALMVNLPCPDGTTDRIVGFRVHDGSTILGKGGLYEPIAWLRSVTIDRPLPSPPAQDESK